MQTALTALGDVRDGAEDIDRRGAIELDEMTCRLGPTEARVGPISAHIHRGELVMVTGSQSGRHLEVVLRVLHGDRPIGGGQARVAGCNLRHIRSYTVGRLHRLVGYVEGLDGRLTPADVLGEKLCRLDADPAGAGWTFRRQKAAVAALGAVGLSARLKMTIAGLPEVERRLVGIAAAIVQGPSILLVNDPTSGLDGVDTRTVVRVLRRLQAEDLTVVVGTWDPRLLRPHRGQVLEL
ncbi:MAG: hypothetical protein ACREQM_17655 [Candidatus Dormibacteraceae bacterium]